jgi:hypothetical protein
MAVGREGSSSSCAACERGGFCDEEAMLALGFCDFGAIIRRCGGAMFGTVETREEC